MLASGAGHAAGPLVEPGGQQGLCPQPPPTHQAQ